MYKLWLRFADGTCGEWNYTERQEAVKALIHHPGYGQIFKQSRLGSCAVSWVFDCSKEWDCSKKVAVTMPIPVQKELLLS